MTTIEATWHDLTWDHGVLELHEHLSAGIGLELHLVVLDPDDTSWAWWVTHDGGWLGLAQVGVA